VVQGRHLLSVAGVAAAILVAGCDEPYEEPVEPVVVEEEVPEGYGDLVSQETARLADPSSATRRDACVRLGRFGADADDAVGALAEAAMRDGDEDVRLEAVWALGEIETLKAAQALERVVMAGRVDDRALKSAANALAGDLAPGEVVRVFSAKAARTPASRGALSGAMQRVEPTRDVKRLLLQWAESDDVGSAKLAAECLFYYLDRGADTFGRAVKSVMPRLDGHGLKLAFARKAAATETLEGAMAVATVAAESDDRDDWRAAVEVFRTKVLPEHQECFQQFRTIAVKNRKWRLQIDVRKLIREEYAEDLTVIVNGETFTFDGVWTREDLLDWEIVQRRARRDHAIIWASAQPGVKEIGVVETPKDYVLLDEEGRVVDVHVEFMTRGVMTPANAMYIVVLPAGAAQRLAVKAGDQIEFDRELVHALSEMELQDVPPGRRL
jgi:hypothetical protein